MNDNEGTIPQQIAHLESMASTMREDLEEARAELKAKPEDERLAKQVKAGRDEEGRAAQEAERR